MDIDDDSARVKFPPPFAFLGTLLAGIVLGKLIGSPDLPLSHSTERGLGGCLALLGIGIMFSAANLFHRAGTEVKPWKRSSALVTEGVYRWTRNPMYLGMALLYAGVALWLDSLTVLLLLVPLIIVVQTEVIEREEAYLAGKFGEPYLAYKASVRRWI